jgi:two-component system cell cycle response regulator DivK
MSLRLSARSKAAYLDEERFTKGPLDKTVLVVEDNDANMRLYHDVLEVHGCTVLQAKDGTEGWRIAREHRPDLILMDIQLPGVSGLEVIKQLKANETLKSIPVIAITAFATPGDEGKFWEGGCDAYIAKPISIPNFLQTLERLVKPLVAEREAVQN